MEQLSADYELARANEILRRAVNRLATQPDLNSFLLYLLSEVAAELASNTAVLTPYDSKTDTLSIQALVNDGVAVTPEPMPESVPRSSARFIDRLRTNHGFTTFDSETDADLFWPGAANFLRSRDKRFVISFPIFANEELLGQMSLAYAERPTFSLDQVSLVQALGHQAALAIQLTRLAEEVKQSSVLLERERAAQQRASELAKANEALQATIDALGEITSLDQIVPRVLKIVADTFGANSCAIYTNQPSGRAWLQYWFWDGKTLLPEDLIRLDPEKFATVRELAEGFDVPDAYLGAPASTLIGPVVLDHMSGTTVPEFDAFAVRADWELELNIGVARGGVRAFTLCVYRKRTNPFTASEIALAEALAKQLGLASETGRLAEEARDAAVIRERERAAQERAAELERINKLLRENSQALARVKTPEEIFEAFLLHTVQAVGSTSGGLLRRLQGTEHEFMAVVSEGSIIPRSLWPDEPIITQAREVTRRDLMGVMARTVLGEDTWVLVDEDLASWAPGAAEFHRGVGTQAFIHLPFRIGQEIAGYVGIGFPHKTRLSSTQRETLRALSSQASLALELQAMTAEVEQAAIAREQEKAAQEQAAELAKANDVLRRASERLVKAADASAILPIILAEACGVTGAIDGVIYQFEEPEACLRLVSAFYEGALAKSLPGYPFGDGSHPVPVSSFSAWARLIGNGKPSFTRVQASEMARPSSDWHHDRQHQAILQRALMIEGQPLGLIGLAFREDPALTPLELEMFNALSQQATLALQVHRLSEAAREEAVKAAIAHEREKAAQDRIAELGKTNDALMQTLDVVAFEPELNKVLGHVLASITKQLRSFSSALWLLDPVSGKFQARLACEQDRLLEFTPDNRRLLENTWGAGRDLLFKDHVHDRKPVVYQVEDLRYTNGAAFSFLQGLGVQSLLGVPLLLGPEIVGSLTVRFDTPRTLNMEELELTQVMAHQATMAIQLTRLAERAGEAALGEERARFARDVHDTLAQGFTGILMQLGAASQVTGDKRADIQSQLDAISTLARASLAEARRSVRALRPSGAVAECQLDTTIEQFVERVRLQTTAEVSLRFKGTRGRITTQAENELCRITQESLNNALRHARAKHIYVSVEFQETDAVRISVKDDGVGFDTASPPEEDSFGLIGMQERASSIRASLTVISEKGRGTEVVVQYQPGPS